MYYWIVNQCIIEEVIMTPFKSESQHHWKFNQDIIEELNKAPVKS